MRTPSIKLVHLQAPCQWSECCKLRGWRCPLTSTLCLQAGNWSWLATGLPSMRTLLLTNFGTRQYGGGRCKGRWPAALVDCTGLKSLRLHGTVSAPVPGGPYLHGLRTLEWLGDPRAAVPSVIADAERLEELMLAVEPQHIVGCHIIDQLPRLRKLSIWVEGDFHLHVNDLLSIQQRLPGVRVSCEYETKEGMSFVDPDIGRVAAYP